MLEGESYRDAARAEGIEKAWREAWRNAGTVPGLRQAHLEAWRWEWGERFPPMWEQHIRTPGNPSNAGKAG